MVKPENTGVSVPRPRAPRRPKPTTTLPTSLPSGGSSGAKFGVGDVIPVSIISCGALRRRETESELAIGTHPGTHLRTHSETCSEDGIPPSVSEDEDDSIVLASFLSGIGEGDDDDDVHDLSGSSTSVVAAVTSPAGVPVAFITTQLSDNDDEVDDSGPTMTKTTMTKATMTKTTTRVSNSATPVIEWIPCAEMNVETTLEAR